MANEFFDLFNQLFYSTEVWGYLGIALVLGFFLVVAAKVKFAGIPFTFIMVIMGLDYLAKMTATGYYVLHFIICIFGAILMMWIGVLGILEARKH